MCSGWTQTSWKMRRNIKLLKEASMITKVICSPFSVFYVLTTELVLPNRYLGRGQQRFWGRGRWQWWWWRRQRRWEWGRGRRWDMSLVDFLLKYIAIIWQIASCIIGFIFTYLRAPKRRSFCLNICVCSCFKCKTAVLSTQSRSVIINTWRDEMLLGGDLKLYVLLWN